MLVVRIFKKKHVDFWIKLNILFLLIFILNIRFFGTKLENIQNSEIAILQNTQPGTAWAISVPTTAWRGGGSDPTPCYLENQWSYRTPRGGVRKPSTNSSQNTFKILKLTLSFGTRSGQRSNFDVSVWWSLGPAIPFAFARNSPKVT